MDGCRRILIAGLLVVAAITADPSQLFASEAQWIWANGNASDNIATGEVCYFRRPINLRVEVVGKVEITADDEYELYVNGRKVGNGQSTRNVDEYDITNFLTVGRNVVAVRVANRIGTTAALAARVNVQPKKGATKTCRYMRRPTAILLK